MDARTLKLLHAEIRLMRALIKVKQRLLALQTAAHKFKAIERDEPYDRDGYGEGSDGS